MIYDAATRTLTLTTKTCQQCSGRGTVPARITCPPCHGTGDGPRGGSRGCKRCYGAGEAYDGDNPVTCPDCDGQPAGASPETWTDIAPVEAVTDLPLILVRQDRESSWNEQFLGLGCLWSCTDYGRAWAGTDEALLHDVAGKLTTERVQAIKVLAVEYDRERRSAPITDGLYVVLTRDGYSVRAMVGNPLGDAAREPDYTTAHRIGMAVYRAGGNGTMAAALPLPADPPADTD